MGANTPGLARKSERRDFIGGSDARIIMGDDEAPSCAYGGKSEAKSSRRTCPATSSSSSAWPPRT